MCAPADTSGPSRRHAQRACTVAVFHHLRGRMLPTLSCHVEVDPSLFYYPLLAAFDQECYTLWERQCACGHRKGFGLPVPSSHQARYMKYKDKAYSARESVARDTARFGSGRGAGGRGGAILRVGVLRNRFRFSGMTDRRLLSRSHNKTRPRDILQRGGGHHTRAHSIPCTLQLHAPSRAHRLSSL